MPSSIKDYRNLIDQPYGRMFYDLIYKQLNIQTKPTLDILDFGAGFCVTANHYAIHHNVTAVEPDSKMYNLRIENNNYTLIKNGIDYLKSISDNSYDLVICHNVLEYAENKMDIINELIRVLKPKGRLSIVKHNLNGRIMANAVFGDNPKAALELLNNNYDNGKNMFGHRNTYSNDLLINTMSERGLTSQSIYAIRTFFGLSDNNKIKYTGEWYNYMLELEWCVCDIEDYKRIAFFNHLIFTK